MELGLHNNEQVLVDYPIFIFFPLEQAMVKVEDLFHRPDGVLVQQLLFKEDQVEEQAAAKVLH